MSWKHLVRKLVAFLPLLNSLAGVETETPPLLVSSLKWSYPETEELSFSLTVKSVTIADEFTDVINVDSSSAVVTNGLATIRLDVTAYLKTLETGKYSIQVVASDKFGQVSETSEPISIEVVKEKDLESRAFAYKEGLVSTNLFFVKPLTEEVK